MVQTTLLTKTKFSMEIMKLIIPPGVVSESLVEEALERSLSYTERFYNHPTSGITIEILRALIQNQYPSKEILEAVFPKAEKLAMTHFYSIKSMVNQQRRGW